MTARGGPCLLADQGSTALRGTKPSGGRLCRGAVLEPARDKADDAVCAAGGGRRAGAMRCEATRGECPIFCV